MYVGKTFRDPLKRKLPFSDSFLSQCGNLLRGDKGDKNIFFCSHVSVNVMVPHRGRNSWHHDVKVFFFRSEDFSCASGIFVQLLKVYNTSSNKNHDDDDHHHGDECRFYHSLSVFTVGFP